MTKRYIALNSLSLATNISVGDTCVSINFRGGRTTPTRVNGMFTTDNKELQEAIEADSGYGKSFIEYFVERNEAPGAEKTSTPIDEVINRQSAIEWLYTNLGIELPSYSSILKIKECALENGYCFPMLKQKKQ